MRDDEDDVARMARWLSDPRVLEFYEGRDHPFDEARVREKFGPRPRQESSVVSCIIELDGVPIGYIQYERLSARSRDEYAVGEDIDMFGVDLFIGEADLWGRGIGSRTVAAMSRYLVSPCGAKLVTIDPVVNNARAIRAYEKAGFEKVRVLAKHEMHEGELRDSWLMVARR